MDDDRFHGEADEAPAVGQCHDCGGMIRQGCVCYVYDGKFICNECAERFAWHEFESLSKKCVAGPDYWL